jgi:hypothetical protein
MRLESDFRSNPLWYITTERKLFIAPTWSWTSVRGEICTLVNPKKGKFVSLIKVENVSTVVPYRDLNQFEQVTNGRLEVTRRVIKADLEWKKKWGSAGVEYGSGALIYNDCILAKNDLGARRATKKDRDERFKCTAELLVVGY